MKRNVHIAAALLALALFSGAAAYAEAPVIKYNGTPSTELPKDLENVGIVEKRGFQVPLSELVFHDETGKPVRLSEFFKSGRPVVLDLGYFGCPMLCGLVLNGMLDTLKKLDWTAGQQFEVIALSIDPNETAKLAAEKKASVVEAYGRGAAAASGWHFLTGEETQIKRLASAVGFGYRYEKTDKQFAHGAGIFILTPEGRVSRTLYGIEFPVKDLRLALLEASSGKIGTVVDRLLLFCFHYDPSTKRYSVYLMRLMQVACGGMVLGFGGYLALFWRRQSAPVRRT